MDAKHGTLIADLVDAFDDWPENLRAAPTATLHATTAEVLIALRAELVDTLDRDDRSFLLTVVDPLITELHARAGAPVGT